jgi:predicted alpha/beta superfamily hydrolase
LITPLIVVAIDNTTDRLFEYSFEKRGKEYLHFIKDGLKPQIDYTFRTLIEPDSTGILGSSLGGIISLHAGIKLPETFGMVGPTVSNSYSVFISLLSFSPAGAAC